MIFREHNNIHALLLQSYSVTYCKSEPKHICDPLLKNPLLILHDERRCTCAGTMSPQIREEEGSVV